jgi:hypothetical protein
MALPTAVHSSQASLPECWYHGIPQQQHRPPSRPLPTLCLLTLYTLHSRRKSEGFAGAEKFHARALQEMERWKVGRWR